MGLVARVARPCVKAIVERDAVIKSDKIIVMERRNAERQGQKPGTLRLKFQPGGIGATYDPCHITQALVINAKMIKKRIEATKIAVVAERYAVDIEGFRAEFVGGVHHPFRLDIDDLRLGVEKPANEPGARQPVDLRGLARDPATGLAL